METFEFQTLSSLSPKKVTMKPPARFIMEMIDYISVPINVQFSHNFQCKMSNNNFDRSLQAPGNEFSDQPDLEEFSMFSDWIGDEDHNYVPSGSTQNSVNQVNDDGSGGSSSQFGVSTTSENISVLERHVVKERVAFKMRSEVENLDDGFKWRKYGKKMVKNSPNPRNYYKCSSEGCPVKKRVERDREDPAFVMTTYEGTHNHRSV